MPKAYYDNTISGFLGTSDETILGRLMISDEFRTTIEQKKSWRSEIEILKRQLRHVPDGSIIFEYSTCTLAPVYHGLSPEKKTVKQKTGGCN